jgi:hypothetical protein
MSKRAAREIIFICSGLINGHLCNKSILAASEDEAAKLFYNEFNENPHDIFGPFYKKYVPIVHSTQNIKFSTVVRKAIYNNWIVNAFLLNFPENHAYLVFIKRADDQQIQLPAKPVIVAINNLRFTDE